MIDFLAISLSDLRHWLIEHGFQPFQAEPIFAWVYERGVRNWKVMSNLAAPLREALAKSFRLGVLQPKRQRAGEGGVQKFLWQLIDKSHMDSVLTPSRYGWQLTVSTQVGCPVGCIFCASGKRFIRNLQPAEMIDQFLLARDWAQEQGSRTIARIAFDGMGEPLKNVKPLLAALEAFCDPQRIGFPAKKITISTVGIIEGIERLLQAQLPLQLTVGLHAPNQKLRQKLVPYAKKYRLPDLITVCRRYSMQTGQPVSFDYVLIEGFNDHPDQALELAHLVKNMRCQVRLLACHPVPGLPYRAPSKKAIKAFRSVLFGSKVPNKLEDGLGQDIGAALGQLGLYARAE